MREIVQATVEFEPFPGTWVGETFHLDAAVAKKVSIDRAHRRRHSSVSLWGPAALGHSSLAARVTPSERTR